MVGEEIIYVIVLITVINVMSGYCDISSSASSTYATGALCILLGLMVSLSRMSDTSFPLV